METERQDLELQHDDVKLEPKDMLDKEKISNSQKSNTQKQISQIQESPNESNPFKNKHMLTKIFDFEIEDDLQLNDDAFCS
jgi:hypothetical protein